MYWQCNDAKDGKLWNISPKYNLLKRASENSYIELDRGLVKGVERCKAVHGDYLWVAQYRLGCDGYEMFSVVDDFPKVVAFLKSDIEQVEKDYPYTYIVSGTYGFDELKKFMDDDWRKLSSSYHRHILQDEFCAIVKGLGFQGYFMGQSIIMFDPNDLELLYGDFISKALRENPELHELEKALYRSLSNMDEYTSLAGVSYDSLSKELSGTILNCDMCNTYLKAWQKRQFDSLEKGVRNLMDDISKIN